MAQIACMLCLKSYERPEVCLVSIAAREPLGMRSVTVCRDCAIAITPHLVAWLEPVSSEPESEK